MTKEQRIHAFAELGKQLLNPSSEFSEIMTRAETRNSWYTVSNVQNAVTAIANNLTTEQLSNWLAPYPDITTDKTVGMVLAGNIPLVGFNDILCVLIAGFKAQIKVSSDDAGLTSAVLQLLITIEPRFSDAIHIAERLSDFDLVIATGSDNSSRYFEYYFGKKPHIIRKNRNSVAVISGSETKEQLEGLGHDIFDYFGLGCRSVSKILIPKDYDVAHLFEGIASFEAIQHHNKYVNNYDYNKSLYLINRDKHYDNGFVLLKQDTRTASPLAVVFYEEYDNIADVENYLNKHAEQIQCVTSALDLQVNVPLFALGDSQCPALDDYADGVNTLEFLFANA
ncbi:Acyl-CoA reductase (LuxC) [Sphingobacterium spiritivorum ATCC 33300]|uniref:Acyl-CoA reductase (LuxC) n=1 Tax=Sphingobacterium spiritivorum ATCC 33300 TaxID=525372 RepID=C2G3T2_SPHSI|nr:acyl-CoA reductase [Sphingobacterium spiritivorum]EEI90287.1 Acyl-CoA reductase (LuxC) [Sphingobacterium spiritivorum ATCC 33300]QQS95089.1 acyl-CoA reductase [Sphingobacterium spiritivorum]